MFCLFLILLSLLVIDEVCSKPRSPDNTLESASKIDHVIANEAHLQGIHISHVIHLASLISGPTWRSSLSNNWILELKEGLKREEELLKTKNLENNPEESIWWRPKKYKEFFLDLQNHTTKSSEQLVCVKCDGRKEGRLGNQLFKYAYARILTDHYKTSLSTFVEGDFPCLLDRLPILFYNSPPNLPYVGDQRCHTNSFRFISGHRYYIASFYASCRDKIKDELFAPSPFLKRYLPSPGPNDVVIHLRGGKGFCAKPEWIYKVMTFYYQTILEERKWDNVWLAAPPKEKLSHLSSFLIEKYNARWTPSDGPKSELEDLYFMMRANYLILDFGTFSFWGGFLSSAKEVHVPYCSVHHRMFVEPGADIPEEKDRWKVCGSCWTRSPDHFVDFIPSYHYHEILQKKYYQTPEEVLRTPSLYADEVRKVQNREHKSLPLCPTHNTGRKKRRKERIDHLTNRTEFFVERERKRNWIGGSKGFTIHDISYDVGK